MRQAIIVIPMLGGWVFHFNALSSALAKAGWQVELLSPRPDASATDGAETPREFAHHQARLHAGVRLRLLPYSWRNGHYAAWKLGWCVFKAFGWAFRKRKAIFVLWSAVPIVVFGSVLRIFNRPIVCLVTGLGGTFSERNRKSFSRKLLTAIYARVLTGPRTAVIVHNGEDRRVLCELTGVDQGRVFVTGGCGVDPAEYPYNETRSREEAPIILVPGRLLREKGIVEAAIASGLLTARGVRHRMLFTHSRVEGRAEGLTDDEYEFAASQPDVEFIGYQRSLQQWYARAHIVCSPSWYPEGLQTALVEGAASGCALVAADNVGVRDFIRPEVDGIITKRRDPADLADGLQRMLAEPDNADRMRHSAYGRFLQGFTKEHMIEITFDAFALLGFDPRPST